MAMAATYTTFAGIVVHQRKNGVDTELISDPLGSVVKTKDASGNETSLPVPPAIRASTSAVNKSSAPGQFVQTEVAGHHLSPRQKCQEELACGGQIFAVLNAKCVYVARLDS
jgi:hypothetical protein